MFFFKKEQDTERDRQGIKAGRYSQRQPWLADDKAGKQSHDQHHRNKHIGRNLHFLR